MGLRVIAYAPFKQGKTVLGLTMAELGDVGILDSEARLQHYTIPHPSIQPAKFPFDHPRAVRIDNEMCALNPKLKEALSKAGCVYVVQTKDIHEAGRAIAEFTSAPGLAGIVIDSGSILWDLFQDTRDDSDPKTAMLSWTPIKRYLKRFHYSLDYGEKHILETAHVQEVIKKVGSEFVKVGERPWLEKKTPHWADLTVSLEYPDNAKWPTMVVQGEGIGGAGGLRRGARVENPTFGELVRRVGALEGAITPARPEEEVTYRNAATLERIGASAPIKGVDDNEKLPG
jgi:hypothetical protein